HALGLLPTPWSASGARVPFNLRIRVRRWGANVRARFRRRRSLPARRPVRRAPVSPSARTGTGPPRRSFPAPAVPGYNGRQMLRKPGSSFLEKPGFQFQDMFLHDAGQVVAADADGDDAGLAYGFKNVRLFVQPLEQLVGAEAVHPQVDGADLPSPDRFQPGAKPLHIPA